MLQYNCRSAGQIQAQVMFASMIAFFRQGKMLLVGCQAPVAAVLRRIGGQQHAIGARRGIETIVGIGLLGMEVESK